MPSWCSPNSIVIGNMRFVEAIDGRPTFIKPGGTIGHDLKLEARLGSDNAFTTYLHRATDESITWVADGDNTSGLAMVMDSTTDGCWSFMHGRTQTPVKFTTNLNTLQPTGLPAPISAGHVVFPRGFWTGNSDANLRLISASSLVPTTGVHIAGELVLNSVPVVGEPWAWRCVQSGDFTPPGLTPPVFQPLRDLGSQQTITTLAAITLTPGTTPYRTLYTGGALTADRTATLSKTGALIGLSYKITRTATGTPNLNVLNGTSGPTLKALAVNTWGEFAYDGTDYYLSAYGAL
jgi:hypothetical protein